MLKSWALVLRDESKLEEIVAIEGVVHDPKRGVPLFFGTLDEFCARYKKPFTVHRDGMYLEIPGEKCPIDHDDIPVGFSCRSCGFEP